MTMPTLPHLLQQIHTLVQEGSSVHLPQLLELILTYAYVLKASDIHLEPYVAGARVRVRVDGMMATLIHFPGTMLELLISRLKVLAELDIAEHRLPQDGRFYLKLAETMLEYRLSVCPLVQKEKAVLRLVHLDTRVLSLEELGFMSAQLSELLAVLQKPHGLILVSGPTGSGKTLTQYAMLNFLNQETRNLVTMEDPIEVILPGVNQIHVNHKTGLEFNRLLRAILRQDPDIIMIGEIRDLETAEVALQAAATGHLVLATVHANNAWDSLQRLEHLGVPRYALRASVRLLLAQRLVRCLCASCGGKGQPCPACWQGYRGRTGIFELIHLPIDFGINEHATFTPPAYINLHQAGLEKVTAGITTLAEINRVV